MRTARVLRTGVLPNTRAALADGAITGRHAQVIANAVVDTPAGAVALIEPEAVAAAATNGLGSPSPRRWTGRWRSAAWPTRSPVP